MSRWRTLLAACCTLLGLAPAGPAQAGDTPSVHVPLDAGGAVQLNVPAGFTALSPEEINRKFPRGNAPSAVWGNAVRSVTVAIADSRTRLAPPQLGEFQAAMEQMLPRAIPNLQWLDRRIVHANGREWIRFELTSTAIDTDIHNQMYMTAHRGRMLGVNFNATRETFAAHQKAFEASFQTIRFVD